MQKLSEAAGVLTLSYPAWMGLLFVAAGVALAVYLARAPASTRNRFGIGAGALVCLFAGGHFLLHKTTLGTDGARVYSPLREDARVAWEDVERARLEERSGGRGGRSTFLVLYTNSGGEVAILLSPLSYEERARVLEVVRLRLPRGHLD